MSMIQVHVFTFLVRVVMSNMISIRLYSHLYCRKFMFYLCYLYLYWYPTRFPYRKPFVSINSNITGATSGAGTAYPSVSPACTPVFVGFVLLDMYIVLYIICLSCSSYLFWTLSVFYLWLLITTLISSNLYYTCNCC